MDKIATAIEASCLDFSVYIVDNTEFFSGIIRLPSDWDFSGLCRRPMTDYFSNLLLNKIVLFP